MDENSKTTRGVYLAIDPGESTGWACFDEDGELQEYGTWHSQEEVDAGLQEKGPFRVVIYEDFKLYGHKAVAQVGSTFETVQVIGLVKKFARDWTATIHTQPANIKPIAEKFSGIRPTGPHSQSHFIDAINHGVYWLVKNGIKQPRLLTDRLNQS